MIWSDIIKVSLGLGWFVFGVVWCFIVWFGVNFTFFVVIDVFLRGLVVIWLSMIWCDIIEVSLGLGWFVFGVVWCFIVWFGVIFKFFGSNGCFLV